MRNKKGFTLIEIFVVVLIIGILAAIAWPQYQLAVWKARYSEVLTNAYKLRDFADLYWLTHDAYPEKWEDFDVNIPGAKIVSDRGMRTKYFSYSLIGTYFDAGHLSLDPAKIEIHYHHGTPTYRGNRDVHCMTSKASKMFELGEKICKSLGGTLKESMSGGNINYYVLSK